MRPTTERVREAVFSILGDVAGAPVLDLFCGTGALAIEALSRGAAQRRWSTPTRRGASATSRTWASRSGSRWCAADAVRFLGRDPAHKFDLVLCDPPYKLADRLAADLDPLIQSRLAEGSRVIFESSPAAPASMTLPLRLERRYGDSLIRLYAEPGEAEGA